MVTSSESKLRKENLLLQSTTSGLRLSRQFLKPLNLETRENLVSRYGVGFMFGSFLQLRR